VTRRHATEIWASECQRCLNAPENSPVCERCALRITPEHYVLSVKVRARSRQEYFEYPFYPSGHPGTGPTYWEPGVRTIDESDYEISYADGGRIFDQSAHAAKQCDHCHLRGEEERRREMALDAHRGKAPHPLVQKPSYDVAWEKAWLWFGSGFIPFVIFALVAKSIWVLVVGEVVVFIVGFALSYSMQRDRYEGQVRERDALLGDHGEKEAELQAALDEVCERRT
jgi:hypothetical protein